MYDLPLVPRTQRSISADWWSPNQDPACCEEKVLLTEPQCPPPRCASITDQSSHCSLWTDSKCLYMCVCASGSGAADFGEGPLADGPGLTQINTCTRAPRLLEHGTDILLLPELYCVGVCIAARAVADGVDLLNSVYGR